MEPDRARESPVHGRLVERQLKGLVRQLQPTKATIFKHCPDVLGEGRRDLYVPEYRYNQINLTAFGLGFLSFNDICARVFAHTCVAEAFILAVLF